MNNEDSFEFTPPPFDANAAVLQLKRSLRDLKLTERGNGFELRGKRVLELELEWAAQPPAVKVRMARKLAMTPEWDQSAVRSNADQRKLLDTLKQRLTRWERDE